MILSGFTFLMILFLIGGLALPSFYLQENLPDIFYTVMGISWCGLLFFCIVGCDRIIGYFQQPKNSRNGFWFVKEHRKFKTVDLAKIAREERQKEV